MCTLAWGQTGAGVWVCFNRDEKRSRPQSEQPRLHQGNEHPLIYARDPRGGGTWFAASTAGFVVALLNHYPAGGFPQGKFARSRGQLVLELATASSADAALGQLELTDWTDFAPCYLFILSHRVTGSIAWDGAMLSSLPDGGHFWTTSAHNSDEIRAWRNKWWTDQSGSDEMTPAVAASLMRRTQPAEPACGLTMDRSDARTLSQIECSLQGKSCRFLYREREPEGLGYKDPVLIEFPV